MRFEILLQFIVPLTFLAIWALTSLLNRDAQPLPPRPHRGPGPGGPRPGPGSPPSGRGDLAGPVRHPVGGRLPSSSVDRSATSRWAGPPAQGRPGGPGRVAGPDEGIVILESDARGVPTGFSPSSSAGGRAPRGTTGRKAPSRGRSTAGTGSLKPMEPERPRALTGLVGQSMAQKKARPLEITPLSAPLAAITSTPLTQASQQSLPGARSSTPSPALTSGDLRAMLASPTRLREVALLTELLQPPISKRLPRRPR